MELEDAADAVERVDDELGLLGVVFVEEVDEDFESAAAVLEVSHLVEMREVEGHTR